MNGEVLQGAHVMLVDDDVSVLQALGLYLETIHGAKVTGVANLSSLRAALLASAAPPILLIADFRLARRETGLEAVNLAREVHGMTLPAMLLTGNPDALPPAVSATPALRVLAKPFDPAEFLRMLGELLTERQF